MQPRGRGSSKAGRTRTRAPQTHSCVRAFFSVSKRRCFLRGQWEVAEVIKSRVHKDPACSFTSGVISFHLTFSHCGTHTRFTRPPHIISHQCISAAESIPLTYGEGGNRRQGGWEGGWCACACDTSRRELHTRHVPGNTVRSLCIPVTQTPKSTA